MVLWPEPGTLPQAWLLSLVCTLLPPTQGYLNYTHSSPYQRASLPWTSGPVCVLHTTPPAGHSLPPSPFHLFNSSAFVTTWWTSQFPENPPYTLLIPSCHQAVCYLVKLLRGLPHCWVPSTLEPGSQQSLQECS